MTDRSVQIVPLGEERVEEATALLTRAFFDDPLFINACPDPDLRATWLPLSFLWSVWHGFLFGEALGTAGRLDGLVTVFGPGAMTAEQLERSGFGVLRQQTGGDRLSETEVRLDSIFDPLHALLIQDVPERHWYLEVLAVDPDRQGRGIGGSLLRAVNERADAQDLPVVLLTFQERNVPLYQRYGYAVTHDGIDPTSGLPWWGFRRDPAS